MAELLLKDGESFTRSDGRWVKVEKNENGESIPDQLRRLAREIVSREPEGIQSQFDASTLEDAAEILDRLSGAITDAADILDDVLSGDAS